MADTNLSAVLYGAGDLKLEERPVAEPGPGEVQVAMHSVGICGSDIHYWTSGGIGDFIVREPMVLGHESSGVVSKLGPGVTSLKVGDRVALEPGVPCRACEFCKVGRYNLCPDVQFLSTPPVHSNLARHVHGTLARYHVHAADFCFKLPDHVSFEEGALLEPLSVGVHACRRGGVTLGDRVLVCGAGPIGLVCLLTARAMGAAEIIVTGVHSAARKYVEIEQQNKKSQAIVAHILDSRLAIAKSMGANYTLNVTSGDPKTIADKIQQTMGNPPRITIECSGAQSSLQTAVYATKSGGVVLLIGLGAAQATIPIPAHILCREVDIRGIFRYTNTYPTALAMIASGAVNVKSLVTHHFPLEKVLDAFETSRTGTGGAIKVIIECHRGK